MLLFQILLSSCILCDQSHIPSYYLYHISSPPIQKICLYNSTITITIYKISLSSITAIFLQYAPMMVV